MKKIVIGLMDRLSSYAQRELEEEPSEVRQRAEEEATVQLLEKVRISQEEAKPTDTNGSTENGAHTNGTAPEESSRSSASTEDTVKTEDSETTVVGSEPKSPTKALTSNVRLFEIFYQQVVNLVKTRGLSIQDTLALLVSLANLALYVPLDQLSTIVDL